MSYVMQLSDEEALLIVGNQRTRERSDPPARLSILYFFGGDDSFLTHRRDDTNEHGSAFVEEGLNSISVIVAV